MIVAAPPPHAASEEEEGKLLADPMNHGSQALKRRSKEQK